MPAKPIRVLVVWEPVISTDLAPPTTGILSRVSDRRAQQYWDRDRLLSKAMGEKDESSIVWDIALVYPPNTRWEERPPAPLFKDRPVVRVVAGITQALEQAFSQKSPAR